MVVYENDMERQLMEERAEEVRQVEQAMMELSEISKDCAELVVS